MKKFPGVVLFLLAITLLGFSISCNQQSDAGTGSYQLRVPEPIEGVWEISSRYWYLDDDTLYADPTSILQHKIYYDGYVMWTSDPGPDSFEWHGYGTYKFNNNTLIETLSSMSLAMKEAFNGKAEFVLKTELDNNFLKQEMPVPMRDTTYQLVEEWKRLN